MKKVNMKFKTYKELKFSLIATGTYHLKVSKSCKSFKCIGVIKK